LGFVMKISESRRRRGTRQKNENARLMCLRRLMTDASRRKPKDKPQPITTVCRFWIGLKSTVLAPMDSSVNSPTRANTARTRPPVIAVNKFTRVKAECTSTSTYLWRARKIRTTDPRPATAKASTNKGVK